MINSPNQSAGVPMTHSVLGFFVCASAPNFPWSGTPPYGTAMYHTIAASIHIAPYDAPMAYLRRTPVQQPVLPLATHPAPR